MSYRTAWSDRGPRLSKRQRDLAVWTKTSQMATLLAIGAACMMAIVVEVYHADALPAGTSMPPATHTQAFLAACGGFFPAFLCLQRLNSGSWTRAVRFTLPWLILLIDTIATAAVQLQWFWAVAIAIPLGVVAYRMMLRRAEGLVKH